MKIIKIIIISLLAELLVSCDSQLPKEINPDPLVVKDDSVVLAPKQRGFYLDYENPSRGRVKVELSNYTDSAKTFRVLVEER